MADEVSAMVLRRSGEGIIAACGLDLRLVGDQSDRVLATIDEDIRTNRLNDCRADPQGRLWAGTMSRARTHGTASLYRLEPDGAVERVLAGCTISNGIGWSPDGERMLYIDSTTQRIDVFDFDGATGAISDAAAWLRSILAMASPTGWPLMSTAAPGCACSAVARSGGTTATGGSMRRCDFR